MTYSGEWAEEDLSPGPCTPVGERPSPAQPSSEPSGSGSEPGQASRHLTSAHGEEADGEWYGGGEREQGRGQEWEEDDDDEEGQEEEEEREGTTPETPAEALARADSPAVFSFGRGMSAVVRFGAGDDVPSAVDTDAGSSSSSASLPVLGSVPSAPPPISQLLSQAFGNPPGSSQPAVAYDPSLELLVLLAPGSLLTNLDEIRARYGSEEDRWGRPPSGGRQASPRLPTKLSPRPGAGSGPSNPPSGLVSRHTPTSVGPPAAGIDGWIVAPSPGDRGQPSSPRAPGPLAALARLSIRDRAGEGGAPPEFRGAGHGASPERPASPLMTSRTFPSSLEALEDPRWAAAALLLRAYDRTRDPLVLLSELQGSFGLVVLDGARKKVLAACDARGRCPLYIATLGDGALAVASAPLTSGLDSARERWTPLGAGRYVYGNRADQVARYALTEQQLAAREDRERRGLGAFDGDPPARKALGPRASLTAALSPRATHGSSGWSSKLWTGAGADKGTAV